MPPFGVLVRYVVLVLLWGSTWAAIKIGVSAVPPFVFAFERALAVSIVLTVASVAIGAGFPRDRRTLVAAAVAGVVNTGSSWAIIFWSEQYVPSGLVAVFGAAGPIWTAVFAHFLVHGDRLSATKVAGLVLGIVGIGLLVGAPDAGARPEPIVAAVLLALMPITWAIGTIVQVRVLREGSPLPIVAVGTWMGALVLAPFALAQASAPGSWTFDVVVAFAYLVVFGSCVGLVLQLWLTRRLRPTTMNLSQLLISAQALIVGAVALGEAITSRMLVGAGLVGLAIVLNAVAGGRRSAEMTAGPSPAD
ncbi:MAG TPA: EamA family transporter [Candidatus Limnocylindria bacterium]|nr:EamA family transporter [Candidatus Limnocylindria bacterium]